jgi:hypothetical protein
MKENSILDWERMYGLRGRDREAFLRTASIHILSELRKIKGRETDLGNQIFLLVNALTDETYKYEQY